MAHWTYASSTVSHMCAASARAFEGTATLFTRLSNEKTTQTRRYVRSLAMQIGADSLTPTLNPNPEA